MELDLSSTVPQWETTLEEDQEGHYQEMVVHPFREKEYQENYERSMEYGD